MTDGLKKRQGFLAFWGSTQLSTDAYNILKDQQTQFGFMDVILFYSGHQNVSVTHVTIFRLVSTRIQT